VVLFVTLGLAACNWAEAAKQRFASNKSYLEDRVVAKRRNDLHASDEFRSERPPVDVWMDPAPPDERDLLDDRTEVYEVDGCGAAVRVWRLRPSRSPLPIVSLGRLTARWHQGRLADTTAATGSPGRLRRPRPAVERKPVS
jgi:hypothetical protein